MRNISAMVKHATPMQVVNSAMECANRSALPRKVSHDTAMVVNRLFSELQAVFPAWRNTFPSEEALAHAKKSWIKAFVDAGIKSINQIKLGVKNARACSSPHWPAVGQFVEWCKPSPEDFGLPSREDAYCEAIANLGSYITADWSHVAVQEAVRNTTCYTLKTSSEKVSRAVFYRNYAVLVNRVICGENLKIDIPKAITEKPKFRPAPREVELNYLAGMKKMVGLA